MDSLSVLATFLNLIEDALIYFEEKISLQIGNLIRRGNFNFI